MFGNVKRLLAIVLAAGLLFAGSMPGSGSVLSVPADQCESSQLVFIELSSVPLIEAVNVKSQRAAIMSEQGNFMRELARTGIPAVERFRYETLFNGFSMYVSPGDIAAIETLPGVKAVYPVLEVPIPDVGTSTGMINAPTVVDELGFDGSGVLVAVIDTGIDYNHPDLGGGWGVRVVDGWDFVGDDFNAQIPGAIPVPDDDPMDPNGHGTHVAGIIGANGVVRGVAPGVDFLALKVFGAEGSTTSDIIVAALEMAYLKGADIVNMSLGAAYQWPQYPSAKASDRLVDKGVIVVVSQGNSGSDGVYAGGAPSVASKVLAVASFDNTHSNQRVFLLPDDTPVGYMTMSLAPAPPTEGTSPELVYVGLGNEPSDYEGIDVTGKAVLVSRGLMTFAHKVTMAQERGAAMVMIHNNGPGNFAGTLGSPGDWIPAISISREHALIMLDMMADGPLTVTWTDQEHPFPSPTAGFISSFSSWGPAPDLSVKPDLGAPGGSIYSTYPLAFGGYATLSGTSMAAPHVAGAAALLLESNPKLKPQAAQNILRTTAVPKDFQGLPYLEPVHRQGGGMIDILAAVTTAGLVEPSKVALGAVADETSFSLTVENLTDGEITYTLAHRTALLTSAPFGVSPGLYLGGAALDMPATVTVPAGGEATVEIGVTQPGFPNGFIFSGYVELVPDIDAPILTVPYLGVAGDYLAAPVLGTGAPYYFPWLAELDDGSYYKAESMTIDLSAGETAHILYNLCRQARTIRLEVFNGDGRNYGRVYQQDYVPRNQNAMAFFGMEWTGVDRWGTAVPDGVYTLRLSALKPLGDGDNPDHWDVWTSGTVTVTGSPTAGKGK